MVIQWFLMRFFFVLLSIRCSISTQHTFLNRFRIQISRRHFEFFRASDLPTDTHATYSTYFRNLFFPAKSYERQICGKYFIFFFLVHRMLSGRIIGVHLPIKAEKMCSEKKNYFNEKCSEFHLWLNFGTVMRGNVARPESALIEINDSLVLLQFRHVLYYSWFAWMSSS